MLIWGWRTRFKTLMEGMFHCPGCGGDRHYAHKQARTWFTLFFLPVIPLKMLGEHVECQTCRKGYDLRVLSLPTSAALVEQLAAATREALVWLLRIDGPPAARHAAVGVLSRAAGAPWSEAALDADLAQLDTAQLPARLRQLGDVMSEHGKEQFLGSVAEVAAAGGMVGDDSRRALGDIAAGLGMTPAHARGVIDQVTHPTR